MKLRYRLVCAAGGVFLVAYTVKFWGFFFHPQPTFLGLPALENPTILQYVSMMANLLIWLPCVIVALFLAALSRGSEDSRRALR